MMWEKLELVMADASPFDLELEEHEKPTSMIAVGPSEEVLSDEERAQCELTKCIDNAAGGAVKWPDEPKRSWLKWWPKKSWWNIHSALQLLCAS